MADKRIDELTALASVETTDLLPVWDTSVGQTKNIPVGDVSHTKLADIGTNAHSVIDTFIASKAQASGLASLNASSKVVQDPANATATPTASKIPIADISGKLNSWVDAELTANQSAALVGTSGTPSGTNKFVTNDDTSATAAASKLVRSNGSSKIAEGYLQTTDANMAILVGGTSSNADSLHIHGGELYSTDTDFIVKETNSFSTALDSPGTVTKGMILTVNTTGGTTSGDKADAYSDANADASKNFTLVARIKFTNFGTNIVGGFGITETVQDEDTSGTTIRVKFIVVGTTLYTVTSGGSSVTSNNVTSGITITNFNLYKIQRSGSNIYFYINGTLVATHTTNLPTSSANKIMFGVANQGSPSTNGTVTFYSRIYYKQAF